MTASRDRDLSDLGVKIKQLHPMIQGLQERLAEEADVSKQHTARFDAVDRVLGQHTARLVALERGQAELRQGQAELRQGQAELRQDVKNGLAELRGGQLVLIDLLTKMFNRPKAAE